MRGPPVRVRVRVRLVLTPTLPGVVAVPRSNNRNAIIFAYRFELVDCFSLPGKEGRAQKATAAGEMWYPFVGNLFILRLDDGNRKFGLVEMFRWGLLLNSERGVAVVSIRGRLDPSIGIACRRCGLPERIWCGTCDVVSTLVGIAVAGFVRRDGLFKPVIPEEFCHLCEGVSLGSANAGSV